MERILICPLNWGMGHATRVMHIAGKLHQRGYYVIVAASPSLLTLYTPDLCSKKIPFPTLRVRYSSFMPAWLAIMFHAPVLALQYIIDRIKTPLLVKSEAVTHIISDNRFGAVSRRAHSVYITHLLSLPFMGKGSIAEKTLSAMHRWIANRYDECWIPDVEGTLTGILSEDNGKIKRKRFVGILSMLNTGSETMPPYLDRGDYIAVLISGPEPQRSLIEKKLRAQLRRLPGRYIIAGGRLKAGKELIADQNLVICPRATPGEVKYLLAHSSGVICRAGYSTLMDLLMIGKGAVVIPTPGQTEQEYLAERLDGQGLFKSLAQDELNILEASMLKSSIDTGWLVKISEKLLDKAINDLFRKSS